MGQLWPGTISDNHNVTTRNRYKAQRLCELKQLLRLRPRRVQDLAVYFGVTGRTIERDLQDLRQMGEGLEEDNHAYSIPSAPQPLNAVEALAVHSAARLLVHHAPTNDRHYRATLEKLAQYLPEVPRRSLLKSVDAIAMLSSKGSRTLDQVAQAWFQQRVLRFTYTSPFGSGTPRQNELEVYFYEVSRDNLAAYVIGFERSYHQAVRVFKLGRIESPLLLNDTYEIPESFDPHDYLKNAWGVIVGEPMTVRLRVREDAAYRMLEGGYPHLSVEGELPDGGLIVDVKAAQDENGLPRELLSWVLGWGAKVEVLAPGCVRNFIKREMRVALDRYAN